MKPSVGRIVHYVSYGTPGGEYQSRCRAAVVTEVVFEEHDQEGQPVQTIIHLAVLNPTGLFFDQNCPQDEDEHRGGTWHWPERVE